MNKELAACGSINNSFSTYAVKIASLLLGVYYVYLSGPNFLGSPNVGMRRGIFLLLVSVLVLLKYPSKSKFGIATDYILIIASVATFGYWTVNFNEYINRIGLFYLPDLIFGIVAIVISLEITRRALGKVLSLISLVFLLYGFFGNRLPGLFGHRGFSAHAIVRQIYSLDGIFGTLLYTISAYVLMFVIFGSVLSRFGAGEFFVEFPYALTCTMKAGPAKAAVLASTFFGMLSGSVIANVIGTGTFTIPLMKRAGYKAHVAGAIEPAASVGGMFMPPIMGAAVFIMAELIGVPYSRIMIVSLAPALLYFFSVAVMAHLQADKDNIPVLSKEERTDPWLIFKKGYFLLIPIVVLVVLILKGRSPAVSAYYSLAVLILVDSIKRFIVNKEQKIQEIIKGIVNDLYLSITDAIDNVLSVASCVGSVGIIMAIVFQTGLGFTFTSNIIKLTGGMSIIGILLAFVAAFILGMGMTVTTSYILLAVLVVPALVRLGIPPIAAHLAMFWFSQTSNVTPPVCVAAFAGATIAKSDPYVTGITALKYSYMLFFLPFTFAYTPMLMLDGFNMSVIITWCFALISTIAIGSSLIGFLITELKTIKRVLLMVVGLGLICGNYIVGTISFVIFLIIFFLLYKEKKYSLLSQN